MANVNSVVPKALFVLGGREGWGRGELREAVSLCFRCQKQQQQRSPTFSSRPSTVQLELGGDFSRHLEI